MRELERKAGEGKEGAATQATSPTNHPNLNHSHSLNNSNSHTPNHAG